MAYQNSLFTVLNYLVLSYRGVYSEWLYKRGKKARVMAKAKAAYIVNRGKKAE